MVTASDIIDQLGGRTVLAEKLSIPYTTIDGWHKSGSIPEWRWPVLVAFGKSIGKPLDKVERPVKLAAAA
jgi:hypothetical protein